MGLFGLVLILVYNIVLMLLVTLIIASLTLIERKFLSLLQRRVGPHYVGYKGRLQYIADALKLFVTLKMGTFLFHLILQKSYKTLTTVENLRMWIT